MTSYKDYEVCYECVPVSKFLYEYEFKHPNKFLILHQADRLRDTDLSVLRAIPTIKYVRFISKKGISISDSEGDCYFIVKFKKRHDMILCKLAMPESSLAGFLQWAHSL